MTAGDMIELDQCMRCGAVRPVTDLVVVGVMDLDGTEVYRCKTCQHGTEDER